jgi:hypothetical protein
MKLTIPFQFKQEQPPNVKKPKSILKTESRSDTNQKITLEDKKIEVSDKDKAHVITEDISHSKAEMKPDDVKNSSTTVASVTVKEELILNIT